jgi:hypothetical protein
MALSGTCIDRDHGRRNSPFVGFCAFVSVQLTLIVFPIGAKTKNLKK